MKKKKMYSSQIYKALNSDNKISPYFAGVFPCDQLKNMTISYPSALVANTDPSNKKGEHWVAFHFDKKGKSEYFDSYGFPPVQEEFLSFSLDNVKQGQKVLYNNIQLQSLTSDVCGQYCITFLSKRARGVPMKDIVKKYTGSYPGAKDKTMANEVNLKFGIKRIQFGGSVYDQCCCCTKNGSYFPFCVNYLNHRSS